MADSYQPTYWTNDTTPAVNATNLRKIEKGLADAHGIVNSTLGSTGKVDRVAINDGAGHYLQIPSLTTTERDGLTAANGMIVYNSTLKCLQARRDGAWVDIHAGAIRDDLSMGGKKIQNLGEPVADTDAATRAYVHAHMGNVPSGAIVQCRRVPAERVAGVQRSRNLQNDVCRPVYGPGYHVRGGGRVDNVQPPGSPGRVRPGLGPRTRRRRRPGTRHGAGRRIPNPQS